MSRAEIHDFYTGTATAARPFRFLVSSHPEYRIEWAVLFAQQCRATLEAAAELAREQLAQDPERRTLYVHELHEGSRHAWRPVSRWVLVARLGSSGRLVRL